jgi:hypothetical protein
LTLPFVNPQNGPIMVEAEKGALAVYIESMEPRGENPRGTCAMIPEFGADRHVAHGNAEPAPP